MADEDDHHLFIPVLENSKHSLSLAHTDPNIEFTNNCPGLISNPTTHQQPFGLNDNILDNLFPQLSGNSDNFPGLFIHHDQDNNLLPRVTSNRSDNDDRKKKAMEISCPANSSPQGSANGIGRKTVAGRGKRKKVDDEKKEEKPIEVIHVRAKRGQATDRHSLAERVRRGKINERLRCLQDIVPGCYKTMGMALMLDEIINYVQSLQNQVEFLSMKLSAASTFCDFYSETDTLESMQRAKAFEALKIQNEASSRLNNSAQFAPSGLDFGYYPQLPHNI